MRCFWRRLSRAVAEDDFTPVRDLFPDRQGFDTWLRQYQQRLPADRAAVAAGMLRTNPKWVLRNHLAELAIRSAREGDFALVDTLLDSDTSRVGHYGARFAGVVFPGEVIRASVWNDDDRYVGVVTAPSRGDAPALSDVELLPA